MGTEKIEIRLVNVHLREAYHKMKAYYEQLLQRELSDTEFIALLLFVAGEIAEDKILTSGFEQLIFDNLLLDMNLSTAIFITSAFRECFSEDKASGVRRHDSD